LNRASAKALDGHRASLRTKHQRLEATTHIAIHREYCQAPAILGFLIMRLRVKELLADRGMTAYGLSKASKGKISLSAAYRLARGEIRAVPIEVLDVLCQVFEIRDPGPLFTRDAD
jgi:DNA-binding Xre family transcriptional regulator